MIKELLLMILIISCSDRGTNIKPDKTTIVRDTIASLERFTNQVKIKKSNHLEWVKAITKYEFENYDILKTQARSSAKILYNDSSTLKVDENSYVILVENRVRNLKHVKVVNLNHGVVNGEIKKLNNKENIFEIRTKSGVLKISPGKKNINKFKIEIKESGELIVQNNQSEIIVTSDKKVKSLKENEIFVVAAGTYQINKGSQLPVVSKKSWGIKKPIKVKKQNKSIVETKYSFSIKSPKNEEVFKTNQIEISGVLLGYKLLLNGKRIKTLNGEYKHLYSLNKGLNLLTFQIIKKDQVEYKVLKVYRK